MNDERATVNAVRPLDTHARARIVAEFARRLTAQQRRGLVGKRICFDRDDRPYLVDAPRDVPAALLALHAHRMAWR